MEPKDFEAQIQSALNKFFEVDELDSEKRFIQVSKIPRICDDIKGIRDEMKTMNDKLDPIYQLFDSARGFNGVSVWILKSLAMIGGAILALYAVIEFFKRIGKS